MSEIERDQTRPCVHRAARERLRKRRPLVLDAGVNRSLRTAAFVSSIAIAVLSFTQGSINPHSDTQYGFLIAAYAVSAALTRCGFASVETRGQIVVFVLMSAVFEFGAVTLSGRTIDSLNISAGAAGALVGLTVGRFWYKWRLFASVQER